MIQIKGTDKVRCQWCNTDTAAKEWNDITYSECITREMKRAFKPIFDIKVWGKGSDHFYKCPKCGMWSKGNQLLLIRPDGSVQRGLGGFPVMTIRKESIHHNEEDTLDNTENKIKKNIISNISDNSKNQNTSKDEDNLDDNLGVIISGLDLED